MKSTKTTVVLAAGVLVLWLSCGPVTADPTLDLSNAQGDNGWIDGAYFEQWWDQSAGVGVFEPFVRIKADGTEEAYNTDNPTKDLDALEQRFMGWFDQQVESGELRRVEDDKDARAVLGPKRWLGAQRVRMNRLKEWWAQEGGVDI